MLIFLADSNLVHAYKRYAYKKNINFQKKSLASVRQQTESKKQPASNWEQQKNSPAQIAGLMPDCFGIILPSESAHMCRTCFFALIPACRHIPEVSTLLLIIPQHLSGTRDNTNPLLHIIVFQQCSTWFERQQEIYL